jgi:hypothetical protein
MAKAVSKHTGIPVWRNGIMSERETGVGSQGHRLGVFLRTAPIRSTCTRLLIESGFHTDPSDLAILRKPETPSRIAQGVVESTFAFYGTTPEQPKQDDPNAYHDPETGHWIINTDTEHGRIEMLTKWRNAGGVRVCGHPLDGMRLDDDGVYRQLCENVLLEAWPEDKHDGNGVLYRFGAVGRRWRDTKLQLVECHAADERSDCDCA